jgi:hypothetical protein
MLIRVVVASDLIRLASANRRIVHKSPQLRPEYQKGFKTGQPAISLIPNGTEAAKKGRSLPKFSDGSKTYTLRHSLLLCQRIKHYPDPSIRCISAQPEAVTPDPTSPSI